MKFAQQLRSLEEVCAPEWQGKFIKYKSLKKRINLCRAEVGGESEILEHEACFFQSLEAEVKAVNRNFEKAAHEVLAAAKTLKSGSKWSIGCFSFLRKPCPLLELTASEITDASIWCRQYAIVNATGLRKIAKKHDKYCGGIAGSEFLQRCWDSGHLKWGSFLHSPLLAELEALELVLSQGQDGKGGLPGAETEKSAALSEQPQAFHSATCAATADGTQPQPTGTSIVDLSAKTIDDDDMMCPICLDPMYKPLGLACGHKACQQCALEAAGMHHTFGEIQWVLAAAPLSAECFECRQQNVFRGSVQLHQLGIAIERRYPDQIKAAAADFAEKKGKRRPQRLQ